MRQINIGGELRNLVVEHKRNKKMYLRVKEDGTLYVTCPRYVSEQEFYPSSLRNKIGLSK